MFDDTGFAEGPSGDPSPEYAAAAGACIITAKGDQ